jgi:choline-sulfatase
VRNRGGQIAQFVSLADMAPTILDLLGIKSNVNFSGYSLVPLLEGKKPANWRNEIYTQTNGNELYGIQRSVMTREWKYVYNGFDYDELYHLTEDPRQMNNLAGDRRYDEVVREMCGKLWRFAYEHRDVCVDPYIMVAHAPYGPGIIFEKET